MAEGDGLSIINERLPGRVLRFCIASALDRRSPMDDGSCGWASCDWAYCINGLLSRWVFGLVLALSEAVGDGRDCECGDGTSERLYSPNFSSALVRTTAASAGSSHFHFLARTLKMASVRLAHGQSSAISSRCLTPCVMSLRAVFSMLRFKR